MWITSQSQLYAGDCIPGDRAATDAEVAAWQAKIANPVPTSVALWQAKAALHNAGLLDQANTIIAAANNPVLSAFWANANDIQRSSPTLASLATQLNLTDAQVDQLFIQANAITL